MKNRIYYLVALTLLLLGCGASRPSPAGGYTTPIHGSADLDQTQLQFTGILLEKPWTKSIQSFCAGGSEYYVLRLPDETELILSFTNKPRDLEAMVNTQVTLVGQLVEKVRRINPNEPYPMPTNADGTITCQVFQVLRVGMVSR